MIRRLGLVVALAAVVYVGLVAWAGWRDVAHALGGFHYRYLVLAFALAFGNFTLRALRWRWLLREADVAISRRDCFLISCAGLALTLTPGKVGEALKSYLLYRRGHAVAKTLPTIFVERLTDLFGVILLSLTGVLAFSGGTLVVGVSLVVAALVLVTFRSRRATALLLEVLHRIPFLRAKADWFAQLLDRVRGLLTVRVLVVAMSFAVVAWFCEAVALYAVMRGAHVVVDLFWANFAYSVSTLAGVVFPGGIGGTEGVLSVLLAKRGIPRESLVAIVLLFRLSTLWWATIVGAGALALVSKGEKQAVLAQVEPAGG